MRPDENTVVEGARSISHVQSSRIPSRLFLLQAK